MSGNIDNFLIDIPTEELRKACPTLQVLEVDNKQYIYQEGELSSSIFFIIKGFVRQTRLSEQGDEVTTAFLGQGDIFGALQSLKSVEMEESAQAWPKAHIYSIRVDEFQNMIIHYPEIAWKIVQKISDQKQKIERRLQRIISQTVDVRVVETLCELVKLSSKPCTHGFSIELMMTQQELASFVGASRPVVSTILNKLKRQGLLNYVKDRICINDKALIEYSHLIQ
ncbi:Crp/Fnr family transcriptional regulator [Anaeromicrobium sediminis]|nr:Crp/Fnr family transcriptional regulator [Anaeromicrobium sediminis]